jgi:RNA polymerase sigma factor (TIGR02999 family)
MSPETPVPSEITRMLQRWKAGDREALAGVAALAYDDLRAIAAGFLRHEDSSHTLQATGLVNEIYLRLAKVRRAEFVDRHHFYAFAAQLMRLVLIDHARQSRALKRPSSAFRVPLHEEMAWIDASNDDILALDSALDQLEILDARKVRVIELRYFLGCTKEEAAGLLGVSKTTVERDLEFSRAWLHQKLVGHTGDAAGV